MKHIFSFKNLCLLLAVAAGIFIVSSTANIQGYLSAGDHGRDLYAFERSLHGELAYRDYWWVYGPLMPFYYALFMKLYGVSILSVLAGKAILKLTIGLLIFLGLTRITSPAAALLCALWFYVFGQDFFFTYNHIGGIACIAAIAAMLLSYIKEQRLPYLWTASVIALVLCFIKVNFGLAGFAATAGAAFIADRIYKPRATPGKALFYRTTLLYFPAITLLGYLYLTNGMPAYAIDQCLPYTNKGQTYLSTPWAASAILWKLFLQKFFTSGLDFFFGCVVIITFLRIAYLWAYRRLASQEDIRHCVALAVLGMYFLLNLHEFLRSGVWYRCLWSQALEFMFFFTAISLAIRQSKPNLRALAWSALAIILLVGCQQQSSGIKQIRVPPQYLEYGRAQAYVLNNQSWIKAVYDTTGFLNKTLKPDETFFALPYDPIYYYLTARKSPVQLLLLCDQQNIPVEQEESIIQDLENKHVNWIVVSSRMKTQELGMGTLGVTYGRLIGKYIQDNFAPAAQFGDWHNEPGWGWNHGTRIFKRK